MSVPTPSSGPASTVQATFAATLVDEWIRGGATDAVICPGSRSTPLALALADRPELRVHVRLDERGAGFYALGLAMGTGRPTVLCTTSGTAAAELHASVVEADLACVPVIVCTADRPPELHVVAAPQTIDQTHLFGRSPRWFCEPGVADGAARSMWRSLAARSLAEATVGPLGPGPVHLNLAFREPLAGGPDPLPPGRPEGAPWHRVAAGTDPAGPLGPSSPVRPDRRGLVVAGGGCGEPADVLALAGALGWPVLADPRSGCRMARPGVVAAADALLRDDTVRRQLRPDVVLLLGSPWVSKVLGEFVAEAALAGTVVVSVDPWWRWSDPHGLVAETHRAAPDRWLRAALTELAGSPVPDDGDWRGRWTAAEAAAQGAIDAVLDEDAASHADRLTEPASCAAAARRGPERQPRRGRLLDAGPGPRVVRARSRRAAVRAGQSWSERHRRGVLHGPRSRRRRPGGGGRSRRGPRLPSRRVRARSPDLAHHDLAHHDLARPDVARPDVARPDVARPDAAGCTLVVVDNHGGGIFSFLPQAATMPLDRFEALFSTPQRARVAEVAAGFGVPVVEAGTVDGLRRALHDAVANLRLSVIRAEVPGRAENVVLHDRIHAAVAAAASKALR